MTKIPPGSVIGIVGGGQLGRMTAQAAERLGYKTHIYSPDDDATAKQVSDFSTTASYDDERTLVEFAKSVDVVTFEFENIPYDTVRVLEKIVLVRPNANCLHIAQNRIREKDFLNSIGIETVPYGAISCKEDLQGMFEGVGGVKAVLKTSEFGYDGKGQSIVSSNEELYEEWQGTPSILEGFINFEKEISVILARNKNAQTVCFPVGENVHKKGILDTTDIPSSISKDTEERATKYVIKIADKLDLIGLLAVEFFVLPEGNLLANEIAPRPHNSGHWTMDGCTTSQFEQFIRAICGLDLGSVDMICESIKMKNLIGDDIKKWDSFSDEKNIKLHIYGKSEIRTGRKMGHVNFIDWQENKS